MSVKIGDVRSMGAPTSETITPDDRQQRIQTIGGVVVQDYGHVAAGDRISWKLQFSPTAWKEVYKYWENRQIVDVVDEAGEKSSARIVIKSYSRTSRFPNYINADIELWRV